MEWQLVCEREPLMKAASSIYFGGMLAGALVTGVLADKIGRLPVLAVCLYAQGIMAVALNVVQVRRIFFATKRRRILNERYSIRLLSAKNPHFISRIYYFKYATRRPSTGVCLSRRLELFL